MTDLAASVKAVLERSVLPSVVARGGSLRVVSVDDGVVTLEASGPPGRRFHWPRGWRRRSAGVSLEEMVLANALGTAHLRLISGALLGC